MSHHHGDPLAIVTWADAVGLEPGDTGIRVGMGPRSRPMAQTLATGDPLVSNGAIGADLIRVPAGAGFAPHTHPGDHLLICVGGLGTITYDGTVYPTHAGQMYMISGDVPHAVGAITDHVLIAVGSPHRAVDDPSRATLVEYRDVTAALGSLRCLICHIVSHAPQMLHDIGCSHCPCTRCVMTGSHAGHTQAAD